MITDIFMFLLVGMAVATGVNAILLRSRLDVMRRLLEEERAYNEYAEAKIAELIKDGVFLVDRLAKARRLTEQLRLLYVQHTRAQLAQNFSIISWNVKRKVDHD